MQADKLPEENFDKTQALSQSGASEATLAHERSAEQEEAAGNVVGRYQLLQKLGDGGMGVVWLAEQKEPVRRRVAVKLVKRGMNTRDLITRFESERQALAMMDHPTIAKVYDAGSTTQGLPYFVMEYVAGIPINEYCDKHKLTLPQRLQLFVMVCEGVQHAHQKAIIHRDLKPSNILVKEEDGRAVPKIIDFGVAKALTQKLTEATMFTQLGAIIGTPEYMSPEQADSSGEDIDTRTDVYSLGVVFYELLVGAPPLDLKKTAYLEIIRKLREDDAPKPSTRFRTLHSQTGGQLEGRRAETLSYFKQLQGDLDSIALKALEKDRSRRYGSASEFAADIGRYLNDEPVLAVAPSLAYRVSKFASRNRGLFATLCALALALLLGAGICAWQAVRATRAEQLARAQRDRADSEAANAKAVTSFLQEDLLSQASAEGQPGTDAPPDPDVKVRTLIDRAAAQVGRKFVNKPLVEAEIRSTIGGAYRGLGLYPDAEKQLTAAYELSRKYRGAEDVETAERLQDLANVTSDEGKLAEALEMRKRAFDVETRKLGPTDPKTVIVMQSLGVDYLLDGKDAEAEPFLTKALAIQSKTLGYDNADTLNSSDSLATLYIHQGKFADADALLAKGLQSYRRKFGPEHPYTQREMFGLVRVLYGEGKYAEAETLATQVLSSNMRLKGERHPNTISSLRMLGEIYAREGKFEQGTSTLQKAAQLYAEVQGTDKRDTLVARNSLALAYYDHGDFSRAEGILKSALEACRRPGSPLNSDTANTQELLGLVETEQGRAAQAEPLLREGLAFRTASAPGTWQRFRTECFLGESLVSQKKVAEGQNLLSSGLQGMRVNANRMPAFQRRWIGIAEKAVHELSAR